MPSRLGQPIRADECKAQLKRTSGGRGCFVNLETVTCAREGCSSARALEKALAASPPSGGTCPGSACAQTVSMDERGRNVRFVDVRSALPCAQGSAQHNFYGKKEHIQAHCRLPYIQAVRTSLQEHQVFTA